MTTREPLYIQETGGKASYYLMQGQDRLAIVIPLSETVYGPEIVGDLLAAMCDLTNEAQNG